MLNPVEKAIQAARQRVQDGSKQGDEGAFYEVTPVPEQGGEPVLFIRADRHGRPEALVRVEHQQLRESQISDAIGIRPLTLRATGKNILAEGEHHFLRIQCAQEHLDDAFSSFLEEIRRGLAQGKRSPFDIVRTTVNSWRALLSLAAVEHDPNKLAGLYGELVMLEKLLQLHGPRALETWKGPDSKPHDFRAERCALEVKTSFNRTTKTVTIHGLTQLDPPPGATLYMALLQVDESPDGDSVDDLLRRVRAAGVDAELLTTKLKDLGYVEGNSRNARMKFSVAAAHLWEVGEDAPGLRLSQLTENHIRGLVGEVSFRFSLSELGSPLTEAETSAVWERFIEQDQGQV